MSVLPLNLKGVGLSIENNTLLRDINHSFRGSCISALLGHNGAGKTLLLKICHGLITPTLGNVQWSHPEQARLPRVQAMVFQKPVLLRRSVRQNIEHVLKACGYSGPERTRRTEQALEMARLVDLEKRPARNLSGGEQQRVALARAWAVHPEVLILDEPCTFLDPAAMLEVERIILAFYEAGTKVILATHDLAQARRLAGEIVLMHQGTIAETSPAEKFFAGPRSEEARIFIEGRLWSAENERAVEN